MSSQIFSVAVTPSQRFALFNISFKAGQSIKDAEDGRKYRRFLHAFGIASLVKIAKEYEGMFSTAMVKDYKTYNKFDLTLENVEYALKLWNTSHSPAEELELGELFDLLESAKDGKEIPPVSCDSINVQDDYARWLPPQAPDATS